MEIIFAVPMRPLAVPSGPQIYNTDSAYGCDREQWPSAPAFIISLLLPPTAPLAMAAAATTVII